MHFKSTGSPGSPCHLATSEALLVQPEAVDGPWAGQAACGEAVLPEDPELSRGSLAPMPGRQAPFPRQMDPVALLLGIS